MAGLADLAGLLPGTYFSGKTAKAALFPLDIDDNVVSGDGREFQYWPESIDDDKGTEYAKKQVPGASHPLYQWVAGGERTVSFTAVFTRDHKADPAQGGINAAPTADQPREDQLTRNVDLAAAATWFRMHMYPAYSANEIRVNPPSKLLLYLPNTVMAADVSDMMACVMTKCSLSYKAWFPDGTPRLLEMGLTFEEIVQIGGSVRFVGRESLSTLGKSYGTKRIGR